MHMCSIIFTVLSLCVMVEIDYLQLIYFTIQITHLLPDNMCLQFTAQTFADRDHVGRKELALLVNLIYDGNIKQSTVTNRALTGT